LDQPSTTQENHYVCTHADRATDNCVPETAQRESLLARFSEAGLAPVPSFNPYWDRCGISFEDPDGYRIVLVDGAWK